MADDSRRKLVESLVKAKLSENGDEKARNYVEMPDVRLAEEETESGADRREIRERMQRMALMGGIGMGTTSTGAGLRGIGLAVSTAKGEFGEGRIDVKSIARKADAKVRSSPREMSRYLRSSSGDFSPSSPPTDRKMPSSEFQPSRRSSSVSSSHGSDTGSSPVNRRPSGALLAKAVFADSGVPEPEALTTQQPALRLVTSSSATEDRRQSSYSKAASGSGGASPRSSDGSSSTSSPHLFQKAPLHSPISSYASLGKAPSTTTATNSFGPKTGHSFVPSKPASSVHTSSSSRPFAKPSLVGAASSTASSSNAGKFGPRPSIVAGKPLVEEKAVPVVEEKDTDPKRKYTLEELQKGVPPGVDAAKKEDHLRISQFKKQFGCDPSVFASYPEWKKIQLRKDAKIF